LGGEQIKLLGALVAADRDLQQLAHRDTEPTGEDLGCPQGCPRQATLEEADKTGSEVAPCQLALR
jgi:hypothetical protein